MAINILQVEDPETGDLHMVSQRELGHSGANLRLTMVAEGSNLFYRVSGTKAEIDSVFSGFRSNACGASNGTGVEDCVAGSSEDAHESALRAMEYLQSGARRSLDEVLDAMQEYGASS